MNKILPIIAYAKFAYIPERAAPRIGFAFLKLNEWFQP
jgi:hypothetical protein